MYLEQLKQLEIERVEEKYRLTFTEKENLEKILRIFVENQLKLKSLESLEKVKTYAMEPIDVVKLSAMLTEFPLEDIKNIHQILENNGYYNGHDFILVKENTNTEALEEEILENLITDYYFVEEAFDKDYLIDIFVEEKTHEDVIKELLLEKNLIMNLLNIKLSDGFVDMKGDVVMIGNKYY